MADLVITAASVFKVAGASVSNGTAGATLAAGMVVYADAANAGVIKPADANLSVAAAVAVGIALHSSIVGEPIAYLSAGDLTVNAVLTPGKLYVLSATDASGAIAPVADLVAGWNTTLLGYAKSTTVLTVGILVTGITN